MYNITTHCGINDRNYCYCAVWTEGWAGRTTNHIAIDCYCASSRSMPILDHNVKIIFFKKQVITIYENLYFIKRYYLLKIKFFSDIMVEIIYTDSRQFCIVEAKSANPTTGGGTIEECHKGRTSRKLVKDRPRSYEDWTLGL